MITNSVVWYERLDFPYSVVYDKDVDFLIHANGHVYYSRNLNIIINSIAKNCTSSIQSIGRDYGDFELTSLYDPIIAQNPNKPTVYTILRDPVERFISATNMLIDQLTSFGLKLTVENFTNLDFVKDMHLIPQINRVVQCPHTDIDVLVFVRGDYAVHEFRQYRKWTDLYHNYPYLKYVDTVDQKFYYMADGYDPVREIFADIGIVLPDNTNTHHNDRSGQEQQHVVSISTEIENYVKNFYEPDYKLIELVNFQNK
jgi:hypothetical protein